MLEILRQRPIAQTQAVAGAVEPMVQHQDDGIELVAQVGEPLGILDHAVVLVAMGDPEAAPVGGMVFGLQPYLDAAEEMLVVLAGEFIVVARDIDDARALAHFAQQLLHHIVVGLRLVPALLQAPSIDDVAHQIKGIRVVAAQEVQ